MSNCLTVQLPRGDDSSPAQSLQHLLELSNEEETFQRQCDCCGRETTWIRKEVLGRMHSRESLHCGYDDFFGEEEYCRDAGFWIMDRRL